MKFSQVNFSNFRPYYGSINFDLSIKNERNIILIGGRNGQGKTSFLVGVVWCLYGKSISEVDQIFKKEVKGNYSKFLMKSMNREAQSEGQQMFQVSATFDNVILSSGFSDATTSTVSLIRTYNIDSSIGENFQVLINGQESDLLLDEVDKTNFVNDFIVPIELAKFVFFDAEKIAEIAQLGVKDQASMMDQALGQVLGLKIYEDLTEDIVSYQKKLQKDSASIDINLQIETYENEKKLNGLKIEKLEQEINEYEEEVEVLKSEIAECISQLIKRGDLSTRFDLEELKKKEELIDEKYKTASERFKNSSEILGLCILASKYEEACEHLDQENQNRKLDFEQNILSDKTKTFAENLFNKPPFPDEDIDLEQKAFYYRKAKELISNFNSDQTEAFELEFEHDVDLSEYEQILNTFDLIQKQSTDSFEIVINDLISTQNELSDLKAKIRNVESMDEDEFLQSIRDNKNQLEEERDELNKNIGKNENDITLLIGRNEDLKKNIDRLLEKVKVSKKLERQIEKCQKFQKVLEEFVQEQKQEKKGILEKSLQVELQNIMTKKKLFSNVEIDIHRGNMGMEVKLYDLNGDVTNPSTWSKGEQQLYVSCLLKAILNESVFNLPVMIDTPLGRLDQEHRDRILEFYYPSLSEQVIIFSTNTEIRKSDLPNIKTRISSMFRLENKDNKTHFVTGYFE